MTPDELRKLAAEATPGPWRWYVEDDLDEIRVEATHDPIGGYVCELLDLGSGAHDDEANARLIALAPDLAQLCAEQHEALDWAIEKWKNTAIGDYRQQLDNAIAVRDKLSELNNRAEASAPERT